MSNAAEFLAGTDPRDPASFLGIQSIAIATNGFTEIRWQSILGQSYVVKDSDDFVVWSNLDSARGGDQVLKVVDPTDARQIPRRVYRVFLADF